MFFEQTDTAGFLPAVHDMSDLQSAYEALLLNNYICRMFVQDFASRVISIT